PDYSPRDQTQRGGDRRPQRQAGPDEPVPGSPTVFPPDSSPPSSGPPRQGGGTVIAQDRQTRGTTGTSRSGPWRGQRQGSASSSGSFEIGVQVIRPGSSHDPSGDPRYPDEPPGRPQQDPATQRPLPGSVDDQPDRRDTQTGAPSGSGDVVAPYPTRKGSARRPGRDDSVWPPAADPPSPAAGDEANDPPVNIASAEPRPKSPPVLRRGNTGDPVSPAAPAADRRDSEDTIVLKTSLVSLNVSVTDRSGKCLSDLKREDFQVFEDDAPQQVEFFAPTSAPFNLVLLLDLSGSISDKIDVVKTAALRFLEVIGPQDKVAVVTFTRRVRVLSGLTADRDLLRKRIKEVEKSEGGTALYEAVWFALVDTLRGTQGQRNAIVVMTDGVDNSLEWFGHAPSRVSFEQLAQRLEESDVIAFPIYIDTEEEMVWNRMVSSPAAYDAARAHLRQIAELTGGQMFRADKVKDLARVYDQVAAALRTIYSVGYYPTNQERDGTFRRVRVQVNRADAATRTRRGYYAN
ncbi:MAG TPA: VWA domain-containing protein, partial [Blastocatellia bacterium]|nr:VWA domain-containing protein [Blastocatellia bacterium]